ncbi:MAG: fatty acid metabolism transcriptional regulator FadR [Chloroflexota bacterium]
MDWQPIQKPAEMAESRLLEAILTGVFPINSNLPGERDLADQLGVTRPTLREALQRLARDGWVEIRQGKPTRVRDYWREGSLGVLSGLARSPAHQDPDFVSNLLEVRMLLAPAYTEQALRQSSRDVMDLLANLTGLEDDPAAFARSDWELHSLLTQLAPNPVYRLLLNSFQQLYLLMGERYFAFEECRQHSHGYYLALQDCIHRKSVCDAETLTRRIMQESLALWQKLQKEDQ